jgi:hypothetical protein
MGLESIGRNQRANRPIYLGGFGASKTENILPIQVPKTNNEMSLSDLQTVGFLV